MDQGQFLRGIYVGSDVYERNDKKNYVYLIAIGSDAYRVTSDKDFSGSLAFGDLVCFRIRTRAFNNQVYYNGDLIDE